MEGKLTGNILRNKKKNNTRASDAPFPYKTATYRVVLSKNRKWFCNLIVVYTNVYFAVFT